MNLKLQMTLLSKIFFCLIVLENRSLAQIKFTDLRQELVGAIGSAKQRAYVVTDLLTDGEIATSLFVAQYRKLSVGALLGKSNAQTYVSRLRYLREQNVPTGLRTASFPLKDSTVVIVDDRIARVDGHLDAYASYKQFRLTWESNKVEADRLSEICQQSLTGKLVPRSTLPAAGRPGIRRGPGDDAYKPTAEEYSRSASRYSTDENGVHRPSMIKTERPRDVPDKLPKVPLWQRKLRETDSP